MAARAFAYTQHTLTSISVNHNKISLSFPSGQKHSPCTSHVGICYPCTEPPATQAPSNQQRSSSAAHTFSYATLPAQGPVLCAHLQRFLNSRPSQAPTKGTTLPHTLTCISPNHKKQTSHRLFRSHSCAPYHLSHSHPSSSSYCAPQQVGWLCNKMAIPPCASAAIPSSLFFVQGNEHGPGWPP